MKALLALALLAAVAMSSDVVILTKTNFDSVVNSADTILVKFFAPWCGHCKHLAPEFEKAATELKANDPPVILAEVDCTVETDLATRFSVHGYPTLKIFRKGAETAYNGPREAAGIVKHMRGQAGPAAKKLTSAEAIDAFVAPKDDVTVLGFAAEGSAVEKAFMDLANALREDYRFGLVNDAALIKARNSKEGIVVFRSFDGEDKTVSLDSSLTLALLTNELHRASVPLAGVFRADLGKRYEAVGLPRLTVWVQKVDEKNDPSSVKYYINRLRKAAKEFKGRLVFALADQSDHDFTELKIDSPPAVVVGVISSGMRYKAPADLQFSADQVAQFARAYLDGKVERYLKSEPVPENNDEAVRVLVGTTFQKEVMEDSARDYMILFYAPWCGHCKKLEPDYAEMAKKFVPLKDKIVVAKVDATANDYHPQFQVHGFPTMYFLKAGEKTKPIEYKGERTKEAIEKFILENASVKGLKTEL